MRATSQASLSAAAKSWEYVLSQAGSRAREFGNELFAVSDLLEASGGLRRALTDPSRDGDDKAQLATSLWSGKAAPEVVELLTGLVRGRWSTEHDLGQAAGILGTTSVLAAAENAGKLEQVEEELFRVNRLLADNRDLRIALSDKSAATERRTDLVRTLLGVRVQEETLDIVSRQVERIGKATIAQGLTRAIEQAAARRKRKVAVVTAAGPLNQTQIQRLRATLTRTYGQDVEVNVAVDPTLVGGLRIQIGDEVVDATVVARLEEARRRLAGIQTS